jgi:hypothetical protein
MNQWSDALGSVGASSRCRREPRAQARDRTRRGWLRSDPSGAAPNRSASHSLGRASSSAAASVQRETVPTTTSSRGERPGQSDEPGPDRVPPAYHDRHPWIGQAASSPRRSGTLAKGLALGRKNMFRRAGLSMVLIAPPGRTAYLRPSVDIMERCLVLP